MVAEVATTREPASAPNQSISFRTKAQVRTLYLVEGHNPKTIESLGVGLTASQISRLAHHEGWTKQRAAAAALVEKTTVARADSAVKSLIESIAVESEELCFKALNQTRAGLDKGGLEGAKQAQAASSTLKNLAGVAQSIRQPKGIEAAQQGPGITNFFFVGSGMPQGASDPKPVTEIEAKPAS
jgi:hypothetical protein